jgi:protein SCO1/2
MKRALFFIMALLLAAGSGRAAQTYSVSGLVLKVDPANGTLVISCEKIPGYMDAMVMSFPVSKTENLAEVGVGTVIEFKLVVDGESAHIEAIRVRRYESAELDPSAARRLKILAEVMDGSKESPSLKPGKPVPDFALVDQEGKKVALSEFAGKVVVLTFTYTHCALPNFCFRIANHFRLLQKRFAEQLGRDLIFVSITFDPVHDTPEVMAKYGKTWNADPKSWKLLTGAPPEVEKVCNLFGISFWPDEGLMTHSLHTLVVGRDRSLVADLEGNEFSADQLGDLVQTVLARTEREAVHAASQ